MKILQIVASLNIGGAEKFAVDLCNELAMENDVYLCILDKIDNTMILKKQINENVTVISLNKTKSYSIDTVFNLYQLVKQLKPDIIHTHLRALAYSSLYILLLKVPVVHTIHNLAHKEVGNKIQKLYKILFNYFNVTPVSISQKVLESTEKVYGINYTELIYNGVKALKKTDLYNNVRAEVETYKKNKNTKVLLNVGRISKQKNQLMIINVIEELNKVDLDFVLLFIGPLTDDKGYADQCLKNSENISNIFFLGEKSNIGDYMYCADAFCLCSLYEGLPLVVLEAMSVGIPILSTPAGGVPDIIKNGVNGYLSDDFTEKAYKQMLVTFYSNTLGNHEENRRTYEENYSMQICMNHYYALYERLQQKDRGDL